MPSKLKWCREGVDNHEDLYLIPMRAELDENGLDAEGQLDTEHAVAWIKIGYSSCRFYNGRGGEGTSRPDAYAAYVKDATKRSDMRLLVTGSNTQVRIGGIFSDKYTSAFTSLRAAKKAVETELKMLAQIGTPVTPVTAPAPATTAEGTL
jgi:hypothetical protein